MLPASDRCRHAIKTRNMKRTITIIALAALCCSCGTMNKSSYLREDEMVTVGYGSINTDENNFAVSKVKPDKKATMTYSNMYDYLRGRVPGVIVTGNNSIIIRGIGSNGETSPLILVDGVEVTDLSHLDPHFVSSVEVLKDASSSMYGMRGANGVILITTIK